MKLPLLPPPPTALYLILELTAGTMYVLIAFACSDHPVRRLQSKKRLEVIAGPHFSAGFLEFSRAHNTSVHTRNTLTYTHNTLSVLFSRFLLCVSLMADSRKSQPNSSKTATGLDFGLSLATRAHSAHLFNQQTSLHYPRSR